MSTVTQAVSDRDVLEKPDINAGTALIASSVGYRATELSRS